MAVESVLSNDGKSLTISISGRFDFEIVQEFRAAYGEHKDISFIIDMRATEHMDSSALGMLLNMRKGLGDNTKISIINCRPQIKKILTISRFDKKFDIE
jgi:anti-anti-sigma factor